MIVEADDISDEQKARICKRLGEADKVCASDKLTARCFLIALVNFNEFDASKKLNAICDDR